MSESYTESYKAALLEAIDQLAIVLDDTQIEQLLAYHSGLIKWNKAYNLTAVRDPMAMVQRHLIDSLSILPFLPSGRLLDVGTGGGLPGMVVAITRPDIAVTLLDSNGKKIRFLRQMTMELGLKSVATIQSRVESYSAEPFDVITSRAFATLADMVTWSQHLLAPDGQFIAMKGLYPDDELAALPSDIQVTGVRQLQVPGADGQRHLVVLSR